MSTTTGSTATAPARSGRVGRVLQKQGALIALVVLVVFGTLRYGESFATGFNVQSVLADDAKYALVALGMCFVIMTGGIDLSVGSVAALGGVVAVKLSGAGLAPALLAAVAVGAAAGLVNGVLIARFRLAPFLVTLASLLVARGLALYLANARAAVADPAAGFTALGGWKLLGLPVSFWIVALLYAVGALALARTDFGRNVLAVGGNEDAARLMGLPVNRTKVAVYTLSAALAGMAGLLQFSKLSVGDPTVAIGLELDVIAAVIIGGGSLTGGRGTVLGTIIGAAIMTVIQTGCTQKGLPNWVQQIVTGGIIVAAVALDRFRSGRTA